MGTFVNSVNSMRRRGAAAKGFGLPRGTGLAGAAVVCLGLLLARPAAAAPTQPNELDNPLVPVSECEYCHSYNNLVADADDPMYAPYFTWRGSMMANAARDPVFWAAVAVASQDAVEPEETQACIRCHSPRAFLEGRADAIASDELLFQDLAGVECEACHRMVEDGPAGNGQYTIDDELLDGMVPRRGPWSYSDGDVPPPPHAWVQDDFVGSSEACGTCHDVTTDRERVDAQGNGLGTNFNEQRTYSEWANSAMAQPGDDFRSCQDCHMPAVTDMPGCRDHVAEQHVHEQGGRRHDLLGANRFVVELLAADATLVDSIAFDHTLEQMDAFVRSAATLVVDAPASVDLGQGLSELSVTVTNETGHKLPTGYSEGRVMWLEVIARVDGETLWSSGRWDADAGSFETDAQLRTYRAIAQQQATGQTFHLLRNDVWVEDTRIPPRGLTPDPQTDPITDRYPLGEDGTWPHFDTYAYEFEGSRAHAEVDSGDLEVSVRLLYLVNTPEYIEFLAEENQTNEAGNEAAMLFDTAGGAPALVVAEQTVMVPIALAGGTTGGSSSGGGGSSTTSSSTTTGAPPVTTTDGPLPSGSGADESSGSSTAGGMDEDKGGCGCDGG